MGMDKITRTYSIKKDTHEGLKKLAEICNCTMSTIIDQLVAKAWQEVANTGSLPQQTETEEK